MKVWKLISVGLFCLGGFGVASHNQSASGEINTSCSAHTKKTSWKPVVHFTPIYSIRIRYNKHNLVVHGWSHAVYKEQSWTGLNAGVFLIRNCQWSMELIDEWARMGPQSLEYEKWGKTQKLVFKDKLYPESDDQSGLIYLLLKENEKWGDKIYLESEYNFEGYWLGMVGGLDNITNGYTEIEKKVGVLRRRHAEKMSEYYSEIRENYSKGVEKRPFVMHFTGCEPCTGDHNPVYTWEACWNGMQKALNFADNQVLRSFGFVHPDLLNSSLVSPLPFDFPLDG